MSGRTKLEISRREFLQGAGALGLIMALPSPMRRLLHLEAPVVLAEKADPTLRIMGYAVILEASVIGAPVSEIVTVKLYRRSDLLQVDAISSHQGVLQVWYPPGMSIFSQPSELRLEVDAPCMSVLYTDRGLAALRIAG